MDTGQKIGYSKKWILEKNWIKLEVDTRKKNWIQLEVDDEEKK